MKIIFYGGRQAGMVGLLTLLALRHEIVCVVPVDEPVESTAKSFGLNVQKPKTINDPVFIEHIKGLKADLFVSCHGRQIITSSFILEDLGAINLHPCLYKYKGTNPIQRMLDDKNAKASVGVHWMDKEVDKGELIVENFQEVESDTVLGVYNELYPLYSKTLIEALKKIEKERA